MSDELVSAQFQQTFSLYLQGTMSLAEISKKTGASTRCIRQWIKQYEWDEQRKAYHENEMNLVRAQVAQFIRSHRLSAMERHVEAAAGISEQVAEFIDRRQRDNLGINPGALREIAVALKNATDVEARVLGINDKSMGLAMGEEGGPQTAQVNVNLSLSGGMVQPSLPGASGAVIDVTNDVEVLPAVTGTAITGKEKRAPNVEDLEDPPF